MWLRLPYDRGGQGLRLHRLSETVRRAKPITLIGVAPCAPAVEANEPVERNRAGTEGEDRERHRRPVKMEVRPAVWVDELDYAGHDEKAERGPTGEESERKQDRQRDFGHAGRG